MNAPIRMNDAHLRLCGLIAACVIALACSAAGSAGSSGRVDDLGSGSGSGTGGGGGAGGGFDPPAPSAFELSAPAASANFVFVANTTRSTVAKVSASSGAIRIQTIRVGAEPTTLVATPDDDLALVLNEASASVSIIRAAPIGGRDDVATVDVPAGVNRLRIAPGSRLAFAWYDNRFAEAFDETGPLSSVAVIDLSGRVGTAYQLSVGVNVRDVRFDDAGERVFVVTDDGVSFVALRDITGDAFLPPVRFADAGESFPLSASRDVLLSPSGDRAVVRIDQRSSLRVITLATQERVDVALPADASDIRLVPQSSRLLFSVGGASRVGTLDLDTFDPADLAPVTWIETPNIPVDALTIAPDGERAIAYERFGASAVAVIDVAELAVRSVELRKGIESIDLSDDGRFAIVIHDKEPGDPIAGEPEADIIAKSYAFSAMDLARGIERLVLIEAGVKRALFDGESNSAFLMVSDDVTNARFVEWIELGTFRATRIAFDRPLEHIGRLPGSGLIYVSQDHPSGRIAFLDVETEDVREITGFELNGLID